MKTLVVYDSVFGNTAKVAEAMGAVLADQVRVMKINELALEQINDAELLIVGSPTRGFKPTENITNFFKNLPAGSLQGKKAAAFDTRIPPESINSKFFRKIVVMGGYADKSISNLMKKKGADLLASEGFFVQASEGPMVEGELERAADWVKKLI